MKKILILGATSSLATPFLKRALSENYEIYATTRISKNLINNTKLNWKYLDLNSQSSVNIFLRSFKDIKFDIVFDFIGKTSNFELHEIEIIKLDEYFNAQITNHIYLLLQIQKLINPNGVFVNISTRSVKHGSFDIPYVAAKSAIHNSIFSLKDKISENQKIINIVSGLIENSTMFNQMSAENISSHRNRADKNLLTLDEFANILIELCKDIENNKYIKYSEIIIGPDYD
jgi:NADP-dependent 3-hydroxy acid dehydrogenase YdfG